MDFGKTGYLVILWHEIESSRQEVRSRVSPTQDLSPVFRVFSSIRVLSRENDFQVPPRYGGTTTGQMWCPDDTS